MRPSLYRGRHNVGLNVKQQLSGGEEGVTVSSGKTSYHGLVYTHLGIMYRGGELIPTFYSVVASVSPNQDGI